MSFWRRMNLNRQVGEAILARAYANCSRTRAIFRTRSWTGLLLP